MKFLEQPLWHRLLREMQANWDIRRIVGQQKEFNANDRLQRPPFYRVGLIGCGRVARRHAYGYLKSQRAHLVAASDPSEKQRKKAQSRFGLERVYSDYSAMLKEEKLDVVSICAPPRFHAEAVILAANAGVRAILCEKPLGLDLDEADEMIRICRHNGTLLATGHQRRFGEQHIFAKKILGQGAIGRVRHVVAECPRDILRAGIHVADMLCAYVGEAREVVACLNDGKGGPTKDVQKATLSGESGDKAGLIYISFKNGTSATLCIGDRGGLKATLYFLGEHGELELWWDGGLRYRRNCDAKWQVPKLNLNPYLIEFQREVESLMEALDQQHQGRSPGQSSQPLVSGEDGRNSLELVLAILRANQEGKPITLPLKESQYIEREENIASAGHA